MVGAALGFVVELVGQPLVHFQDVKTSGFELAFPWATVALAPVVSAIVFGAVAGLAALPFAWAHRGRARFLVAMAVGLALALALATHVAGLVVRLTSGLYPSPSAATLFVESPVQFLDQAVESYPLGVPALAAGFVVAWAAIAAGMLLAIGRAAAWSRRPIVAAPAATFTAAALLVAPDVTVGLRDRALETTEISLYASMLDELAEEREPPPSVDVRTLEGPPRRDGEAYLARLRELARANADGLPNVVLVVLESVPLRGTGFGGYRARPVTPNLDRLATRSLRLPRAWSTSTHSNYAQMAILSSLFPRRGARLDTYTRIDYPRALPQDLLRPLGYETATFSSQNEDWQGMRRFQTTSTPHHFFASHSFDGPKMGESHGAKIPDHTTVTEAIRWIEGARAKPFYVYLNLQQTHWSYRMPPGIQPDFDAPTIAELRARGHEVSFMRFAPELIPEVRASYDSALRFADAQVGRLVAALRAMGELEDTIVVVTADHGESFGEAGIVTHGKTLREPEARPPLLVYYPRRVPAGESSVPVSHLDVMPTVLELIGAPPYPGYQGASFLDAERFERERRAVFLTMQGLRHADGVVCYPWKLVNDRSARRVELYHLARDPGERRNLATARRTVRQRLEATLSAQLRAQLGYHARSRRGEESRFGPRVARCPELPAN